VANGSQKLRQDTSNVREVCNWQWSHRFFTVPGMASLSQNRDVVNRRSERLQEIGEMEARAGAPRSAQPESAMRSSGYGRPSNCSHQSRNTEACTTCCERTGGGTFAYWLLIKTSSLSRRTHTRSDCTMIMYMRRQVCANENKFRTCSQPSTFAPGSANRTNSPRSSIVSIGSAAKPSTLPAVEPLGEGTQAPAELVAGLDRAGPAGPPCRVVRGSFCAGAALPSAVGETCAGEVGDIIELCADDAAAAPSLLARLPPLRGVDGGDETGSPASPRSIAPVSANLSFPFLPHIIPSDVMIGG
jgi:hypothetical protein